MTKREPSDLPEVLKEITSAVLEGDWTRYSQTEGGCFYYVVREQDHSSEIANGQNFDRFMGFVKVQPDSFWDWFIRAALAEEPTDRPAAARKRALDDGMAPDVFDRSLEALIASDSLDDWKSVLEGAVGPLVRSGRLDAFSALMQAVRIERVRRGQLFISEADRPELRQALEVRFLRELVERYPKVVKRASTLDWLSFSDPQLREACRCYLYGFFGATILIAVAALEPRLRSVAAADWKVTYDTLADLSFGKAGACGFDAARASALKDLFRLRNGIAHASATASGETAENALILVRATLQLLSDSPTAGNAPRV